jgi:outer membrane protein assembly factor BamD
LRKLRLVIIVLSILVISIIQGCSSSGSSISTDDPEKAFAIAKKKFDRGEYLDAIDDFSLIKVKFPGSVVSDKTQFYLAESYFKRREFILAAYEYENMQKNYPLSPLYPDSKYKLGLCYYELSPKPSLDQEFTQYAISELSNFIDLYPNHISVPDAEKKIAELRDKLAFKDFSIAENYMKLDDFRAAGVYYQNVYENYIDSQWADDAMIGHAEALISIKKYSEAKQVLEKFYKLFPKSNLKSKADNLKRSII